MEENEHIEREVEKTFRSLDKIEKAETDAFFYTRLQSRLERRKEAGVFTQKRFGMAFACVLMVIFLNIISVVYLKIETGEAEVRSHYLEEMSDEYGLATTTIYETTSINEQ